MVEFTNMALPTRGLGEDLTLRLKNWHSYETDTCASGWTDPFVESKQWKRDLGFGTWNFGSLNRSGSLTEVARKLAWYKLLSKNTKIKIYGNIILSVVLYGCETSSLTLREERRLRVFEKRVLRRIFGPKRDEVTGEWRNLQNEELNDLYSPIVLRWSKREKWDGQVM